MNPRHHRAITSLIVPLVALGAACTSDVDTPGDAAAEALCDPVLASGLEAWAEAGFNGAVAVSTGGTFDCRAAAGLADREGGIENTPDTVFAIGSISKALTAVAVLALVDDGALTLAERAGDLLPGLSGPAAEATVEQLLLHTSGLTGSHGSDHVALTREAAVDAISSLERHAAPGEEYNYSNAGYTLLALIVEETSRTPYRQFMVERVLTLADGETLGGFWDGEPAADGRRAVGYLDDGRTGEIGDFEGPHWALAGNGDLAMTMPELARWTRALFEGDLLSARSTERIAEQALGWAALDRSQMGTPVLGAAGGGGDVGHNAVVAWAPELDRVVAIASNTPDITAEELVRTIGPAVLAGDPLPRPAIASGSVDPGRLEQLAGTYPMAEGGGTLDVATDEAGLIVTAAGPQAIAALFPLPEHISAADVHTHEDAVLALLAGATAEGREELELLESDFGDVGEVTIEGTIFEDGELRTYATLATAAGPLLIWYALDDGGGIAAVEGPTPLPSEVLVATGEDRFAPYDPAGVASALEVRFDRSARPITVTLTSATGSVLATRAD